MTLDSSAILGIIGLILTLIGCTWKLSAMINRGISATKGLESAVKHLSDDFNSHKIQSSTRDQDNQREHAMLNRCCDANVQAIKNLTSRVEKFETCAEDHHVRLAIIETRLDIRRSPKGA